MVEIIYKDSLFVLVKFFSTVAYFHAQILAFHYKKSKMKLISFFLLVNW